MTVNDEQSQRVSAELTGRMNGLKHVCMLILSINVSTTMSQYVDDSDYEDYGVYDEFLSNDIRPMQQPKKQVDTTQDDFYIINDYEEAISKNDVNKNYIHAANEEIALDLEKDEGSIQVIKPPYQHLKWLQSPERVYQYTKHRIPGYDYHELDFMGHKKLNKCDARSVWSHCVCQFTCSNPNEVDCYMPCISGCECKEAYVFDENSQLCVPLEMCQ
ncbi:uncharacterized protein LOC107226349 [Neodiprion lecontei]|uniref:Uncharacterized protein LOC107226349 n=1 Tax=Neodiprion lecontei TaxID=441921 RepID=A0A6J0C5M6_NEOLC|nr:uncharacterized protein LOC107226349 [Neodiprion lecontei]XP_015522626.1 uncharacterized protein LOC107226349 [Neodiprion lecontei]XP_046467115.1 uncharacterized protein LOC124211763 [Neodiprion pinetum]XP_046467124.1 uncharacterized protein LOC124211763 [Neodiprion pinetum]XP_046467134.1 uncharacterized protein LOC124211763 [Neodiprion pinetum]XP_046588471.1 uncharacterized protein LOC107226349 [Neodiprion lecontei]